MRRVFRVRNLIPDRIEAMKIVLPDEAGDPGRHGLSPLPTAAQHDDEKSCIAIERIQTSEPLGSNHFTAGNERALERAGRIIDSWIPVVYDNKREMGLRQPDDSHKVVTI